MPSQMVEFPLVAISRGPQAGRVIPLRAGPTTVGRDRDRDVRLDDPSVSRQHAEFRRTGDAVSVWDAGSLNGTYVNGRLCHRITALVDGDQVWIGKFHLIFRDRDATGVVIT